MKGPRTLAERDAQINDMVRKIAGVVKRKRVEKDRREQWFANSQLDSLRQLLERQGYMTARVFQVGKIEKGGNRYEKPRNEALLEILDLMGDKNNRLDVTICSYILGKLNAIIEEALRKEDKHE